MNGVCSVGKERDRGQFHISGQDMFDKYGQLNKVQYVLDFPEDSEIFYFLLIMHF